MAHHDESDSILVGVSQYRSVRNICTHGLFYREVFRGESVALAHEEIETYDASYYETQLVRAAESVLSPLGWDRTKIQRELAALEDITLSSFGSTSDLS